MAVIGKENSHTQDSIAFSEQQFFLSASTLGL